MTAFLAELRGRIARDGPIPLADYMAAANAHYYATRDPFGAHGDFVTAPEISQMFGELIGLCLADLWDRAGRPAATYLELGPGRGTLASDALRAMARAGLVPQVHFVETSPVLRAAQARAVRHATWSATLADVPADRPLLVVANEFFDALGVQQHVRRGEDWRIRCIAMAGDGLRPIDGPVVAQPLPDAPEGSIVEHCPEAAAIMADLARRIAAQGGAVLAIDYGYRGPALGDSVQAVRGHGFVDPFATPGESDLTAHVDFTALAAAAPMLAASRVVDQGEWLIALGLAGRAAALARAAPDRADEIAAAYRRLSDPDEMGRSFKVLGLRAPGWPELAGLS